MKWSVLFLAAVFCLTATIAGFSAPVIDPLPNVTVPAGKSLIVPITATSSNGRPLTYTITSSTNAIAVVMHTNDPFWQLTMVQAAPTNAPGAYKTPYRGGLVTVTNVGTMTFMLFSDYAPHTVNVFQGLTYSGFYNSNTIFHRVVAGFVNQGGDPNTNGTGGLVFQYNDEFNPQAIFSGNGQLALANSGKNTDGSQFFITIGQQRFLDFGYTLFGQLVRGFSVMTNINNTPVDANDRPLADEIIQTAQFVTNTTDTVITLTATNIAGIVATNKVIADDGAGNRVTNTFTVTTVTDSSDYGQPFFDANSVSNLVAPLNKTLTNVISGLSLNGGQLAWYQEGNPNNPAAYSSAFNQSNSIFRTLTYNVTNQSGQLQWLIAPTNNYQGPLNIAIEVYSPVTEDYYYGIYNFVFGDTVISGQTNTVTELAATAFTNVLLATFTNGVAGSALTNFTASVNWGDDTVTAGTIGTNATGQKVVLGAHTYAWPGVYPVYVTAQSLLGSSATLLSYVTTINSKPKLSAASPQTPATNGFAFTLQLPAAVNGYIQVSTNLTSWTTLTNFSGTNSAITLRDPSATNSKVRYYRALVP